MIFNYIEKNVVDSVNELNEILLSLKKSLARIELERTHPCPSVWSACARANCRMRHLVCDLCIRRHRWVYLPGLGMSQSQAQPVPSASSNNARKLTNYILLSRSTDAG